MNLNIVRLDTDPTFPMPSAPNPGDAGIDLIAATGGMINPGDNHVIGCGFAIEIPEGYVGLVSPRSGLAAKYHISVGNAPGIIDSSYRGEMKIILEHRGHRYTGSFQWKRGDRLAQLVIVPYFTVNAINVVSELSSTDRGDNGFGSSGVATAAATTASTVDVVSVVNDLTEANKTRGKKSSK